jgi:GTP-binding protein Era
MEKIIPAAPTRSGFVALIGRPNVGKSTLLNALLGKKISITSRKPQTTRHRWLGVHTEGAVQTIYVDTPGLDDRAHTALNHAMNRSAQAALVDVDVAVFVVDGLKWNAGDEQVLALLQHCRCPRILVVNKIDTMHKADLISYLPLLAARLPFEAVIPLSAKRKLNLRALRKKIATLLPEGPHYFPADQDTDRSLRFRMAEIIREKIIRLLGDELPYVCTVVIDDYNDKGVVPLINAIIWLEKEGQKAILIGKQGEKIKKIGIRARRSIEVLVGRQVNLKLWVKIRRGWSDDPAALRRFGYGER